MTNETLHPCPECGAELENGYLGYGSGLLWHRIRLSGPARIGFVAIPTGQYIVGNWRASGFVSQVPARKCPKCGTVVLPNADAQDGREIG
jgi:predicted RNA-binding Zn-ribbon protein involved in translation (DUF1610 family)